MTEAIDLSEALIRPVVLAMVQSAGMDEDKRAHLIASTLAQAIHTADLYLLQGATIATLNTAMLQAQAIIQMQGEELLRLAIDGADVNPDLLGEMETVQLLLSADEMREAGNLAAAQALASAARDVLHHRRLARKRGAAAANVKQRRIGK